MNVVALLVFAQIAATPSPGVIRINQLGYLPDVPKVAVYCGLQLSGMQYFRVSDAAGKTVLERRSIPGGSSFTPTTASSSTIQRARESSSRSPAGGPMRQTICNT